MTICLFLVIHEYMILIMSKFKTLVSKVLFFRLQVGHNVNTEILVMKYLTTRLTYTVWDFLFQVGHEYWNTGYEKSYGKINQESVDFPLSGPTCWILRHSTDWFWEGLFIWPRISNHIYILNPYKFLKKK